MELQDKNQETADSGFIYQMYANPRCCGGNDTHFIQAYEMTTALTAIPRDVLFIGTPYQCRDLLQKLTDGALTQKDVKDFFTQKQLQINAIFEGLTTYAIERQNGMERHQPPDATPWAETRRAWISGILQGMAELESIDSGPELLERFDQRLEQAGQCFAVETASVRMQRETIRGLQNYASALERQGGDPRPRMKQVYDLLEDMVTHLSWDSRANGLWDALDQLEQSLPRLTAQQPIRFTRILLGGEIGPGDSGFVSGVVRTAEEVMDTELYAEQTRQHPEMTEWPAICVTYNGGGRDIPIGLRDATEFDLELMRMAGTRFLDLPSVRWCGTRELRCVPEPAETMTMTM